MLFISSFYLFVCLLIDLYIFCMGLYNQHFSHGHFMLFNIICTSIFFAGFSELCVCSSRWAHVLSDSNGMSHCVGNVLCSNIERAEYFFAHHAYLSYVIISCPFHTHTHTHTRTHMHTLTLYIPYIRVLSFVCH